MVTMKLNCDTSAAEKQLVELGVICTMRFPRGIPVTLRQRIEDLATIEFEEDYVFREEDGVGIIKFRFGRRFDELVVEINSGKFDGVSHGN